MKYTVLLSAKFKKDYKLVLKRGYNMKLLQTVINTLTIGDVLASKYKDHALSGRYAGYRECHVTPDWLLVYKIEKELLVLALTRTGSHSDLF